MWLLLDLLLLSRLIEVNIETLMMLTLRGIEWLVMILAMGLMMDLSLWVVVIVLILLMMVVVILVLCVVVLSIFRYCNNVSLSAILFTVLVVIQALALFFAYIYHLLHVLEFLEVFLDLMVIFLMVVINFIAHLESPDQVIIVLVVVPFLG